MPLLVTHFLTTIASILLLVAISVIKVYGQDSEADSLRLAADQATDPEVKAQFLLKLYKRIRTVEQYDPVCLFPLEESLLLAEQENLTDKLMDALRHKALYYQLTPESNYDSTFYYLNNELGFTQQQVHQ